MVRLKELQASVGSKERKIWGMERARRDEGVKLLPARGGGEDVNPLDFGADCKLELRRKLLLIKRNKEGGARRSELQKGAVLASNGGRKGGGTLLPAIPGAKRSDTTEPGTQLGRRRSKSASSVPERSQKNRKPLEVVSRLHEGGRRRVRDEWQSKEDAEEEEQAGPIDPSTLQVLNRSFFKHTKELKFIEARERIQALSQELNELQVSSTTAKHRFVGSSVVPGSRRAVE